MDSVGTAGRPPVHIEKLREFLLGKASPWLQTAAIGSVFRTSNIYGLASLPVWNELFEVAVNERDWQTREACQALVYKYLDRNLGTDELFYRMRTEVEKEHPKDVVGFFITASMAAIRQGRCGDEPFDVLAALIEKDENAPNIREAVFLNLRTVFGATGEFSEMWGRMKQAIVRREAQKEVSELRNLQGMMKPQGAFQEKVQPKKPERTDVAKIRKVARS